MKGLLTTIEVGLLSVGSLILGLTGLKLIYIPKGTYLSLPSYLFMAALRIL